MRGKLATICAVMLTLAISTGSAFAAGRGGGGGGHAGGGHAGGGWHGSGGHGNWHGHSHGYWRGGVFIGLGAYGPYWPYWGYPYSGYAYPSYYPYGTDPYYVPPVYMEQDPMLPRSAVPNNPGAFWYFCPDSRQYYPSVQSCQSDWQRVPSTPPPG
jgi:hypothetical protein